MCPLNKELQLSRRIEDLLVARNLRGMAQIQPALQPGYVQRSAKALYQAEGKILIGTGFWVAGTFETDGPVGAIALYLALKALGKEPVLVCGNPLYSKLSEDFNCFQLPLNDLPQAKLLAQQYFATEQVGCVLAIERPGLNQQGGYCNMRGEDISHGCASFDPFIETAPCTSIAIGDGGNEIGMGKVASALSQLDIIPSITSCDELIVADVSNWGAYGLIAFFALWQQKDMLAVIDPPHWLAYLSKHGSVDGVTKRNEATEDSLDATHAQAVITELRRLTGFLPIE